MARRRKVWVPFLAGANVAANAQSSLNLLTNLPIDITALGGLTVVRIIGEFRYHCATVGTLQQFGGAITVHDENNTAAAFAADLLVTPKPGLMWTHFTRVSTVFVESAAGTFDPVDEVVPFDIRSMRKMAANEILRFYIDNSAGQTIVFHLGGRVLLALP